MTSPQRKRDDNWQLAATEAAIAACRDVVGSGINGRSVVSSLGNVEWGWIAAAAVFAWIKTRAQQAVEEGLGYEEAIRDMTSRDPAPWEYGAIETILPQLGSLSGVDWAKPVGEWSKDQIISFAWQIYRLSDGALAARDQATPGKIVSIDRSQMEREVSAANRGSLMSRSEMDDDIPF